MGDIQGENDEVNVSSFPTLFFEILPAGQLSSLIRAKGSAPFEIRLSSAGSERRYRVEIEAFEFATRPEGG